MIEPEQKWEERGGLIYKNRSFSEDALRMHCKLVLSLSLTKVLFPWLALWN